MSPVLSNTPESKRSTPERVALGLVLFGAVVALVSLLFVMLARRSYPFDLEWMEGGMLTHAARLAEGRPIYAKPSLDFIAYFYTPLYPALVAALSKVTPLSYALGRSVSLLATLGTLLLLYDFGRREAGRLYGILAAGLYAALFRTTGAFYDLVRPDALAIFLTLAGAWVTYYGRNLLWTATAALIYVAAYYTKQTSIIIALFTGIWLILQCRIRGTAFFGITLAVGLTIGLLLDQNTGGWFRFYVLKGHQTHEFLWKNALLEYWRDLLFLMPVFCLLPLLRESYGQYRRWMAMAFALLFAAAFIQRVATLHYDYHQYYRELWYENPRWALLLPPVTAALLLGFARLRARPTRDVPTFFLVFLGAGVLASLLNHCTQWAYSNCFMPIALATSLYTPLAVASFVESFPGVRHESSMAVCIALIVQEIALGYSPRAQVPDARDLRALANLDRVVSGLKGKVLMPAHPYFIYERGGPISLHQVGIGDVYYAGGVPDLETRMRRHEFAYVLLDSRVKLPVVNRYYRVMQTIFYPTPTALLPRTGYLIRPQTVYQPK